MVLASLTGRVHADVVPPSFIENAGQFDARARFVAKLDGTAVFVTDDGLRMVGGGHAVFLTVENAATSTLEGEDAAPGRHHYFLGPDPDGWRRDVVGYRRVRARDIRPGVDLILGVAAGKLHFDMEVRSGARSDDVVFRVEGAPGGAEADDDGSLRWGSPSSGLKLCAPRSTMIESDGRRVPVSTTFVALGPNRFAIAGPQPTPETTLWVDPTVEFSTFLGGTNTETAFDATFVGEELVLMGATLSVDFPTTSGALQPGMAGSGDAFVVRLTEDGNSLVYATYLGGPAPTGDYALSGAVNAIGDVFITGRVAGAGFPTTPGAFDDTYLLAKGFVARISADGATLQYSSYVGGSGIDDLYGVAVDPQDRAYLTGATDSPEFPVTPNGLIPTFADPGGGFLLVISADGSTIEYGTFLDGPIGVAAGRDVALGADGSVYVTGLHTSFGNPTTDFPLTHGAYDVTPSGGDAFVIRFMTQPWSVVYATLLGGSTGADVDRGLKIVPDPDGVACFGGFADSGNFPTTPGAVGHGYGAQDAFFARLSADGSTLLFCGTLGGNGSDEVGGLATDESGAIFVTGATHGSLFMTTPDAFQPDWPKGAGKMGWFSKVSADGSTLLYSTFLGGGGGTGQSAATAVATSASGKAAAIGGTTAPDFPTTPGALDSVNPGQKMFVTMFDFCGAMTRYGTPCPNGASPPPVLDAAGCATSGWPVEITLTASPGSSGVLLTGLGTHALAIVPGCHLQIGPLTPAALPFMMPASGALSWTGTFPVALPSGVVSFQAIVADPAAPYGITGSRPLRMELTP